jgi:hypothetical protein
MVSIPERWETAMRYGEQTIEMRSKPERWGADLRDGEQT